MDFQVVELDKKAVDDFWHLRKELFLELGEITTETDVEELESASKKYYLDHIGKDLLNWGIRQDGHLAAIGSLCLFSRIPYQENLTGQEGYILNIFTSKNYRKQGMANQILDAIIDEAKSVEFAASGCRAAAKASQSTWIKVLEKKLTKWNYFWHSLADSQMDEDDG